MKTPEQFVKYRCSSVYIPNFEKKIFFDTFTLTQQEITCSKLTTETLEQSVKYV